ncbi:MAG: hypothetical protein LC109_12960 [Bacteroidia bacterium]|nr:hypothetical protein [Bacteroidia bacterium]
MTANWFLLILWMFVAAIAVIEMTAAYLDNGLASMKTWLFFALLIVSFFFIVRLRKLRNKEKIKGK